MPLTYWGNVVSIEMMKTFVFSGGSDRFSLKAFLIGSVVNPPDNRSSFMIKVRLFFG